MMKNYHQSVEINHNPNWTYIPDHLIESKLLVVPDEAKLMCY